MTARNILQAAAGTSGKTYVDDVFSTYLYNGNGTSQTINNGIDLAGKGGMTWIKQRSGAVDHRLQDTTRGAGQSLVSSTTGAAVSEPTSITSFAASGFVLGANTGTNTSGQIFASWTFRNAPKFFTHTTVSHTNGSATNINLTSLGTVGMVVAKITNTTGDWITWHRSLTAGNNLRLNTTAAQSTTNAWLSVSGTTATLSGSAPTGTYVIYAWAHDTASDGMVQCGSYTGTGGANSITLGWEPQFLLVKRSSGTAANWVTVDALRGIAAADSSRPVFPNTTGAETTSTVVFTPTATGADFAGSDAALNGSGGTYVYLAIRIPNKPPTSGTEVFQPVVYTGTNTDNRLVNTGIKTDMVWLRERNDTTPTGFVVGDRLRGQPYLWTGATSTELSDADSLDQQIISTIEYGTAFSSMNGVWVGNDVTSKVNSDTTSNNHIALAFQRRPGFFDIVCYTGTGSVAQGYTNYQQIKHNLTVAPELVIIKDRNAGDGGGNQFWPVYCQGIGDAYMLKLNTSDAKIDIGVEWWALNNTTRKSPDSNYIYIGNSDQLNYLNNAFVAYLFATLPGISKVGSYTGNGGSAGSAGTSQTINCGFSTGARFVLIKRTDSTGGWWVFDSARGIVAGIDPAILADSSPAAEVGGGDALDPHNSGFIVNQLGTGGSLPGNLNVTGATYIYLAIA